VGVERIEFLLEALVGRFAGVDRAAGGGPGSCARSAFAARIIEAFRLAEKIVEIAPRPATLKRKLRKHLLSLGFGRTKDGSLELSGEGKDAIRSLHHIQRNHRIGASKAFIHEKYDELIEFFASGSDIVPERITPVLQRISAGTWESDLFRMACLTWAIPVSNGFGRRLRYLVWDANNDKLIGLIAIGDPVFNLSVRDNLIGWNANERSERLVNMLDAYVLGAVPPYNMLLGGKLVSALIRSRDIYDDFSRTYGGTVGIISGKEKKARLLAVTTSSSLGRSSVYNRLKLGGIPYFTSIGYTGGWGHFHIPDDLFCGNGELRDGAGLIASRGDRMGGRLIWRGNDQVMQSGLDLGYRNSPGI
jgi:hypothetical protein